jgi:hypothetical protein
MAKQKKKINNVILSKKDVKEAALPMVKTKKGGWKKTKETSIVPVFTEREGDIVARAVMSLDREGALIPEGTTKEEITERILDFVRDWSEAAKDKRRVSGRDGKKFLMPQNYLFQTANSKSVEDMEYELDNNILSETEGRGIGDAMLNHLYVFGRKTIDELVSDLKAIDKNLLIMGVNDLINKCWLKTVNEKDEGGSKITTIELVTAADRKRLLKKK